MGDMGKIWNERKFKHLTGTDQIFEFKVEADRVLCFFLRRQETHLNARVQEDGRQDAQGRNRAGRGL